MTCWSTRAAVQVTANGSAAWIGVVGNCFDCGASYLYTARTESPAIERRSATPSNRFYALRCHASSSAELLRFLFFILGSSHISVLDVFPLSLCASLEIGPIVGLCACRVNIPLCSSYPKERLWMCRMPCAELACFLLQPSF